MDMFRKHIMKVSYGHCWCPDCRVLSQGLALPLDILESNEINFAFGDEVTEQLGVTKYEPPEPKSLDILKPMPGYMPRTDEIRLQSVLGVLDDLRGHPYYITEKVDGTSGTFMRVDEEFMACSRNNVMKDGNNHFWNVVRKYKLDEKIQEGFSIQGEVCGPGIQKNRLGLDSHDIRVFNIFNVKNGQYLGWEELRDICADLGVPVVKLGARGDKFDYSLEDEK